MSIIFVETDTGVVCAVAAYCSGATLVAGTKGSSQAIQGGTLGVTPQTPVIDKGGSSLAAVFFELPVPAGATWASGSWVVRLDVGTANSNITWVATFICRISSGCVSQATIGSLTGQSISLGTTGVKSMTITGNAQTPASGDKVYIVLLFSNASAHSTQSFGYTPDQNIDSPFTIPAPVNVSGSGTVSESGSVKALGKPKGSEGIAAAASLKLSQAPRGAEGIGELGSVKVSAKPTGSGGIGESASLAVHVNVQGSEGIGEASSLKLSQAPRGSAGIGENSAVKLSQAPKGAGQISQTASVKLSAKPAGAAGIGQTFLLKTSQRVTGGGGIGQTFLLQVLAPGFTGAGAIGESASLTVIEPEAAYCNYPHAGI